MKTSEVLEGPVLVAIGEVEIAATTRAAAGFKPGATCCRLTSSFDCGYDNGLSSTALTTLKIAVFAPIPSASVSTAASVKPGAARMPRSE